MGFVWRGGARERSSEYLIRKVFRTVRTLRRRGVWGNAPQTGGRRAAAVPATRQMRCWLSSERTTNPSSRRKRQDSLSVARPLPTETASLGFGGSPVGGGDKNSRFAFFRHFCVGVVSLPSGRFVCVGTTPRGVYFSRKNGFLRVGALRRRTRCSLLHTALFRRSCMGVVSLPSACVSCCRNAGRPRVTAAYSPFLCRRGARPVRAEYPLGGYTRHPSPEPRTQRLTRRNTGRFHRLRHRQGR